MKGAVEFGGSIIASLGCTTLGGPPAGAACAAISTPIAIVGTSEMVGGLVVGGHGGAVVWNNANNPLQISGSDSSSGNYAYDVAKSGGKHSGTYQLYRLKPTKSIESALKSYKDVIKEHYDKLANSAKWVKNWDALPEWRQEKYFDGWREDIARNQEPADIMKGILQERGVMP